MGWWVWLSFCCASSKPRLPVSAWGKLMLSSSPKNGHLFTWKSFALLGWVLVKWKQTAMKRGSPPIFLHAVQVDTATVFISSMAVGDSESVFALKGADLLQSMGWWCTSCMGLAVGMWWK